MIQAVTTAHGPSQSYATYSASSCAGSSTNQCAASYYWSIISPYVQTNPGAVCWPNFNTVWTTSNVTFSPRSGFGGNTQPNNRYDFMSTYTVGDQSYMKSFFEETESAWNSTTNVTFDCLVQNELLVSFTTPTTTTAGTQASLKFINKSNVQATSGVAAQTTICTQQVGANSSFSSNGTYSDVTVTKQ